MADSDTKGGEVKSFVFGQVIRPVLRGALGEDEKAPGAGPSILWEDGSAIQWEEGSVIEWES